MNTAELVAGGMPEAVALGRIFEPVLDVAREPGPE
jgi:hypothetical protein